MNRFSYRPFALSAAAGVLLAGVSLPIAAQQQQTESRAESRAESYRQSQAELASRQRAISESRSGADYRARVLEYFKDGYLDRKPVIGVLLVPDEISGVRIAGVTPNSGAEKAGIKSGDRLFKINGKRIEGVTPEVRLLNARRMLSELPAGQQAVLVVRRDGNLTAASVKPELDQRVFFFNTTDGSLARLDGNVVIRQGNPGITDMEADSIQIERLGSASSTEIAPEIRREIIRLGSDCKGEDCKFPVLAEAFRWNGLNLASVDAGLGRYFGATKGVLVLSTGKDLDGLQAGDVIRSIGGKEVATPREAMDSLRAQPAGGKVAVAYLRDRAPGTAQVSVPESLQFKLPMAAVAPRAPGAPGTVEHPKMVLVGPDGKVQTFEDGDGKAPPAWIPNDGQRVEKRRYVMVDKDGKRTEWEGDAGETAPAWVQALPKDGERKQVRKIVMMDANGKVTELETDELPPPAPPAPPRGK